MNSFHKYSVERVPDTKDPISVNVHREHKKIDNANRLLQKSTDQSEVYLKTI